MIILILPTIPQGSCKHTPLVPVNYMDFITAILSFLASAFAVVGGVGGGGLFVPFLMLLLNFDASSAVPISKAMIFCGTAVSMIFIWPTKVVDHGSGEKKPAIDLNACLLLQPLCLAGTVIGVFLNVLFPSWVIVSLLCIVLGFSTYKTIEKGIKQYKKEKQPPCPASFPLEEIHSAPHANRNTLEQDKDHLPGMSPAFLTCPTRPPVDGGPENAHDA
eukprot:Sdes_comp18197_c0_seq1m7737